MKENKKNKNYIVGICGGSASGKTYLLNRISQSFDASQATIISLDNYYKPFEEQVKDEYGKINFDHPQALDLNKFYQDLKQIIAGNSVTLKEYTFNNPNAPENWITYAPAPWIVCLLSTGSKKPHRFKNICRCGRTYQINPQD
jgi:uridine kinase